VFSCSSCHDSTGVTGYIAGDAFHELYSKHPNYQYSLLVRTKDKAEKVLQAYKTARIVLGSLDDSSLLEEEAANADIVLRGSLLPHLPAHSVLNVVT